MGQEESPPAVGRSAQAGVNEKITMHEEDYHYHKPTMITNTSGDPHLLRRRKSLTVSDQSPTGSSVSAPLPDSKIRVVKSDIRPSRSFHISKTPVGTVRRMPFSPRAKASYTLLDIAASNDGSSSACGSTDLKYLRRY